jgi:F-box protein 9
MVSTTITTTAATAQPVLDLITSFANISIEGELPLTEISPAPPCPIAHIPEEVLVDILLSVAITDLSSLVRLSQVSKRLAYLISSEDGLWRRVTQHLDFGFPSMLYNFTCKIEWDSILDSIETIEDSDIETPPVLSRMEVPLPLSPKYPTYRQMFKTRPRIRFNGCYISTVNYTRPGAVGSNSLTWNHNILIVTYYRYLRFFRDGSLISLLTTSEPSNVVPYLQKEYIRYQSQGSSHLPQAVMKDALKGRWHLSGDPYGIKARSTSVAETDAEQLEPDNEGDIHIETEGVVAKYKYAMQLRFASAGTGTRNNKLNWVGYWCQNKLTDDVGEFGLKNDRPYFWSRVKSWY